MSDLYVKSALNPYKAVKFNLSLVELSTPNLEGESSWFLEIGTLEKAKDGSSIAPVYIDAIYYKHLDKVIEKEVNFLCTQINWDNVLQDKQAPLVVGYGPKGSNVDIDSYITFVLEDTLPSSGLDLSNISITLNNGEVDFDITDKFKISGNPFRSEWKWKPEVLY
jgi:hypothetical protein